jgi:hypothetical protein
MYIAIIIFTILSIFGEGYIERNNKRICLNLFAIIDLILIIIYFWKNTWQTMKTVV